MRMRRWNCKLDANEQSEDGSQHDKWTFLLHNIQNTPGKKLNGHRSCARARLASIYNQAPLQAHFYSL